MKTKVRSYERRISRVEPSGSGESHGSGFRIDEFTIGHIERLGRSAEFRHRGRADKKFQYNISGLGDREQNYRLYEEAHPGEMEIYADNNREFEERAYALLKSIKPKARELNRRRYG